MSLKTSNFFGDSVEGLLLLFLFLSVLLLDFAAEFIPLGLHDDVGNDVERIERQVLLHPMGDVVEGYHTVFDGIAPFGLVQDGTLEVGVVAE